jgi:hypothetical protein
MADNGQASMLIGFISIEKVSGFPIAQSPNETANGNSPSLQMKK